MTLHSAYTIPTNLPLFYGRVIEEEKQYYMDYWYSPLFLEETPYGCLHVWQEDDLTEYLLDWGSATCDWVELKLQVKVQDNETKILFYNK